MIRYAFAGEWLKLLCNQGAAFWAFLFTPLVALTLGLGKELFFRFGGAYVSAAQTGLDMRTDLARATLEGFGQASAPLTQVFCLIGAATIFAGEYQWETWRLIVTRQERTTILGAKIAVFFIGCLACTAFIGLAGLTSGVLSGILEGFQSHELEGQSRLIAKVIGAWATCVLDIMQLGAVAAIVAVVSRSTFATFVVPLALYLVQILVVSRLADAGALHPSYALTMALPNYASGVIQLYLSSARDIRSELVQPFAAFVAGCSLLVWNIAGFGIAAVVFCKQDLNRG